MDYLRMLKDVGAIVPGHFILSSGLHSDTYINKDMVYLFPNIISDLCYEIANHFKYHQIDAVVGPAMGGIIMSQWVAYFISEIQKKEIHAIYAEKKEGSFVITRGYEKFIPNKNILLVEDVITTGASIAKVGEEVGRHEGNIVGLGALCLRSSMTDIVKNTEFDFEIFPLVEIPVEVWDGKHCPLCKNHIPINTNLGKGEEFLNK